MGTGKGLPGERSRAEAQPRQRGSHPAHALPALPRGRGSVLGREPGWGGVTAQPETAGPQPLQVCRGCTRVGSPKTQLVYPTNLHAVNMGERRWGVHRLPLTAGSSPAAEPPGGPLGVPHGWGRRMRRWAPAPLPVLAARPEASAPAARVVLKRRQQNRAVNFPAISYSGNVSSPRKPRPAGLIKSSN